MTGMCPPWRANVSTFERNVSSFGPDVSTFRPNVSSFGGNVSSFRPDVSTLAGQVSVEEGQRGEGREVRPEKRGIAWVRWVARGCGSTGSGQVPSTGSGQAL